MGPRFTRLAGLIATSPNLHIPPSYTRCPPRRLFSSFRVTYTCYNFTPFFKGEVATGSRKLIFYFVDNANLNAISVCASGRSTSRCKKAP